MMRANLLPRPKVVITVFGTGIDARYVRQAAAGIVVATAVTAIGIGIESLRLGQIAGAAESIETTLSERAPARDATKRLALDVARYQEIAREEATVRESGALAATTIARIGNAIPARVWLDAMTHDSAGYELTGGSRSVDALSGAVLKLDTAIPERSASIVGIDNRDPSASGVHFTARIAEAAPGARTAP